MYNQYNGQFSQLVFFLGDSVLTSQILEKINDNEFFNFSDFNFKLVNDINLPDKKDIKSQNPLQTEGLLSYDWIERRIYIIPSMVLYALDWSIPLPGIDWKEKESILMTEYFKFKESLKSKNIKMILLIFMGKNTSYNLALDEKMANIKKNLDIEHSRFIFLLPGGLELITQNKKKLQKAIEEISHSYYKEYLKRIKKKITKLQDITSQEKNLKVQIKAAIISEIMKKDKSLKHYNTAYDNLKLLTKYYNDTANFSIKENDFPSFVQNYEALLRNEELRYISDVINFRIIHLTLQKGLVVEAFTIFDKHYKSYKGKINYFEGRLTFEEYRWRSEYHRNFGYILLRDFYNIKKLLLEKNIMFRFLNLFHASVIFSDKRNSLMWQKNKDWASFANISSTVKKIRPLYFGRNSYKMINESNPLEKAENSKKITEYSIYFRVFEEVNRNVAEENLEILRKIEKFGLKEDSDLIFTKYYLAQNYLKNKDFDNFIQISNYLLKFLTQSRWISLLLPLLQSLEELLKSKPNLTNELLQCSLDLLIHKPDISLNRQARIESITNLLQNTEKELVLKKTLNNRDIIAVEVNMMSSMCHYYEGIEIEIRMILECEGLVELFNILSLEFNEKAYNLKFDINEMKKDKNILIKRIQIKFVKSIINDLLSIEAIELISDKTAKNKVKIGFLIPKQLISFPKNDSIQLKPAKNAIDVRLNHPSSVFLNEQIELSIFLNKNKNFLQNVKNIELFLFDQEIEGPINLQNIPKIQKNCEILTENSIEYDNSKPIILESIDSEEIERKFLIKISEETDKKLTLFIRYSLEKNTNDENNILQRDFIKKLNLNVISPFVMRTRVKILNHYYNNLYKSENIGVKNNSALNLPVNQKCQILYYLTPPTSDCAIKSFFIAPSTTSNFKFLGLLTSSSTLEPIILRQNEAYTGGFMISTLSQIENSPLASITIQWKRSEYLNNSSKPYNQLTIPFNPITIEDRPYEIDYVVKDLAEYGELIQLNLKIRNKAGGNQKIQLNLVDTDGFLISGDVKRNFDLRNNEIQEFLFNLLPMGIGRKKLPGVQFICLSMENKVVWDSSGTRYITVIPKKF